MGNYPVLEQERENVFEECLHPHVRVFLLLVHRLYDVVVG